MFMIALKHSMLDKVTVAMTRGGVCSQWSLGWPVNWAATNPAHPAIMAVVGDDPVAQLRESSSGKLLGELRGHADFSFAAAWHPAGQLLATGNQVSTALGTW